jgi:heavy metal sensor kinase
MNFRSLRFRLISWYALWLGAVFAVAGVLLYFGLRHFLELNLMEIQIRRAERIALLVTHVTADPSRNLAAEITTDFAPEASDRFVRIGRSDGWVIYQSGPPQDRSFDPEQISRPTYLTGTRKERMPNGNELVIVRIVTNPKALPQFFIEVGESMAPALSELQRLLVTLGLAFVVVTLVALVGGYWLVGRSLRPVEEIRRSAEGITSRNLSERLPVPATGDEFEQLSQTLNWMIIRLESAFQHNRRFLADASHEMRTPLTILRGELEMIIKRDGLEPNLRETLGNMAEEVERLVRIVETLFALSRFEAGQAHSEHARFDFAQLAAATAEQMCLLAEDKNQTIACETPAPVWVEGDRARLKQVIVNLLDNAIKYTPAGGAVKLTVFAQAGEAICEVSDNGIGIPASALPHVFDRFFRVDAARNRDDGGAGIGLSIVKVICAAHDGRVEVESEQGAGSRFRVRLPLAGKTIPS